MTDHAPRLFGLGAAVAIGVGIVAGLLGGSFCCLFVITLADRMRLPGAVFVALGVAMALTPLGLLLSRRRPGSPFAIGLLIGLCLTGLLIGACGTIMLT